MIGTGKVRSERWRERRRKGLIAVTVDVSPAHRRAFESMGLVQHGHDRDRAALIWAVERYLDTAPAVQGIGDALFPDADEPTDQVEDGGGEENESEMPSPDNSGE